MKSNTEPGWEASVVADMLTFVLNSDDSITRQCGILDLVCTENSYQKTMFGKERKIIQKQ